MTEMRSVLARRGFLVAAGLGGLGVVLGVTVGVPYGRIRLAEFIDGAGGPPASFDAEATAWFLIKPDNSVTLYIPKIEMGQGVHTALAQVAADELDLAWEQLTVVHAATGQGLDDNVGTSGSSTVSSMYAPLREAAATMRLMLVREAARQLNLPEAELVADRGIVREVDGDAQLTYGEIVAAAGDWELPESPPPLKAANEFRYIGQAQPRVDLKDKILGKAVYGYDVRLPGMLYGAVARPTEIGATLVRAEAGSAQDMPGVVSVVIDGEFAAAVAETREQAYGALSAMDIEWQTDRVWTQADLDERVTVGQGKGVVIQRDGRPEQVLSSDSAIKAAYRTPTAFHAHLEPLAATVSVQPDKVEVWTATQTPVRVRDLVAEAIGYKPEDVVVHPTYLGGGFGHKVNAEPAVEAARLSAEVGAPVQVAWNRAEDFLGGFRRPPTHHELSAVLGGSGRIQAIEHQQASGEVAFPFLPGFLKVVMGADFGSWRGALIPYAAPNRRTQAWLVEMPFATGWWRGLGLLANVFAIESFIDELAVAAGADPIEFRLRHLEETDMGRRWRRVLETAAERSGWGAPLPDNHGRGVAVCADVSTVVAEVVEVAVEGDAIRVKKVTAVVDPGLVVNPDGAKAQVEGAIVMGLSSTLLEEARVEDGKFVASNFNRYPLLTYDMTPEIDTVLLESGDAPHGLGEPPIGPIAAAVANAVYAASGTRLRSLPLRLSA